MKTFKLIYILGMLSIGVLFSCESENETFDTMDADNVADNTASTSNQNPNKVELHPVHLQHHLKLVVKFTLRVLQPQLHQSLHYLYWICKLHIQMLQDVLIPIF